jgi:hypothetical protein
MEAPLPDPIGAYATASIAKAVVHAIVRSLAPLWHRWCDASRVRRGAQKM